ncbi:MAG: hypothetical protein H7328_07095 [Bdellovibrio sp.]|nr:hypothetical protein [Bdellovibrio sp.]
MKIINILLSILFLHVTVQAVELYQPAMPARCFAMGGTCIAHTRGAQALFVNAAALARVEGFDFIVGQVQGGVSKDAERFITQAQGNSSNLTLADVSQLYGKTLTADISARSGLVMPYFGVGAYSQNYLVETFSNPTFPTFNANFISDYGYAIAGAIPVGPTTSFGVTGRHVKRWGGNKDINVTDLVGNNDRDLINQTFQDHGVGNALDLSFITTFPSSLKPTLAMVWQDVGSTRFEMSSGTQAPPSQKDNLIFGASIEHEIPHVTFTHALEYKFITTENETFSKKIHLGTEASFGLIDLRAGVSQGYLTYGAGVDLWLIKADVAFYSTELGTYAGQTKSDRYQASVTINFDFDQSFKLNLDGKKRRLKQRR